MNTNPVEVQTYLMGVSYPCDKDTLLKHAKEMGASSDIMSTLRDLPEREYDSPTDVASELSMEEEEDSDIDEM